VAYVLAQLCYDEHFTDNFLIHPIHVLFPMRLSRLINATADVTGRVCQIHNEHLTRTARAMFDVGYYPVSNVGFNHFQ